MKKILIFSVLMTILLLGVSTMNNKTRSLANLLLDSIYQLENEDVYLDDPGLSNPYIVGVNKDALENQIMYLPEATIQHTINAADYGVNGTDSMDDTQAFVAVIQAVKQFNGEFTEIILPSGDLDFIQGMNPNNLEYGIDLSGLSNVLLSGNNTNIYFYGEIKGFLIENSSNLYIRGINIDWGTAPFSMGTILENDGKTFVVQLHEGYEAKEGMQIKAFLEYDKNAFIPRVKGNDIYGDVKEITILDNNQIQVEFNNQHVEAPSGTLVVLRHYIYEYDCFFIEHSSDLYFENINIYSAPGMGVRAYSSENLYFNRFNTVLKPGTDRLMTTTADGLHMIDCKGDLQVTNSIFENNGDDALNVHGMYLVINSFINSNTVTVSNPRGYNFKPDVGDVIEINDMNDMSLQQAVTVSAVEEVLGGFNITFAENLDPEVAIGSLLGNSTRTAQLVFKNNVVRNKRCRGILIQTRGALVENNVFANLSDAGVLITSDSNDWYESISSRDVVIRNNKFIRNNYGLGGSQGDITVISFGKDNNLGTSGTQKNITIENNFIANSANSGIAINSASEVSVDHNLIYRVALLPKIASYNSGLYFSNCENIELGKNKVISNSSLNFQMVYVGQYVKIDTLSLNSNDGFNFNDILGDAFTVTQDAYKTAANLNVQDGSLDDWNNTGTELSILGVSDVNQNEVQLDQSDFKLNSLKITYKDDGIYFMFDVIDNEMNWNSIDNFWSGDGVEIFLSENTDSYDALNILRLNSECLQIFMNAEFQEVIQLRSSDSIYQNRDQVKLNFWLKSGLDGYEGEGFIPFSLIPNIKTMIDNNQEISLNFVFSDADSNRDRVQIATTTHPVETHKFVPYYMGKILFKEEQE